jgi:hypothetical protein
MRRYTAGDITALVLFFAVMCALGWFLFVGYTGGY